MSDKNIRGSNRGHYSNRGSNRGYYGNRGSWRGRWSGGGQWSRGRGWRGRGQPQQRGTTISRGTQDTSQPPPAKRPHLIQTTLTVSPYTHWKTYLPTETYTSESSGLSKKIKAFEFYFTNHIPQYNNEDIDFNKSIPVNYIELLGAPELKETIPDIGSDIKCSPELLLNSMALAFHTVLEKTLGVSSEGEDDITTEGVSLTNDKFYIRLYGIEPLTPLRSIKAPLFGKCVAISGTVVRVSCIRPLVTRMAFQCAICREVNSIPLPDGKYSLPTKCPTTECRSRLFTPLRQSIMTETIDWQTIRLQERASDDHHEAGRIPRTIDCELTADLVDSCVPGDMVTVTAVVKATGSHDDNRPRSSKDKCMFLLYLHAISVVNSKMSDDGMTDGTQEFSTKDCYAIQEIHSDKDVFKLLVGSLCPTIYGHELVKAGLILGLFGGCQDFSDNQKKHVLSIRGNPHILVVGDPGLGKSQMLQAAANVAPRGVYVCGNTTTSSGLTVTLTKETGSNDYALEAGALVLGDQGCCCIDEFDKMGTQHQALLETMEQQSISIAKAGIVCTLPARTSILAAANPVGGHYNKAKTVSENLKLNSALLSRFDLVFILLDKPDEEMDCVLSKHVMSLHSGNKQPFRAAVARRTSEGAIDTSSNQSVLLSDQDRPLGERLKVSHGENFDPIPAQLLRKYIGYARRYVHPRLSSEAATQLQEFYLELRRQRQTGDCTPITTRQLESLIRLTEARARLELREVASVQDAKDIIEVMKFSMRDTFSDEYGFLDFQRSQHGSGMSQKNQAKKFISELSRMADHTNSSTFTWSQLKEITKRIGLQIKNFDDFIFSLNNQGYLLKKGPKLYKLQTAYD